MRQIFCLSERLTHFVAKKNLENLENYGTSMRTYVLQVYTVHGPTRAVEGERQGRD
jgi:hypothetical protein